MKILPSRNGITAAAMLMLMIHVMAMAMLLIFIGITDIKPLFKTVLYYWAVLAPTIFVALLCWARTMDTEVAERLLWIGHQRKKDR